ncbi:hypothetical protein AB0J52_12550 [Spirillospora sp. NPDC049652]
MASLGRPEGTGCGSCRGVFQLTAGAGRVRLSPMYRA